MITKIRHPETIFEYDSTTGNIFAYEVQEEPIGFATNIDNVRKLVFKPNFLENNMTRYITLNDVLNTETISIHFARSSTIIRTDCEKALRRTITLLMQSDITLRPIVNSADISAALTNTYPKSIYDRIVMQIRHNRFDMILS